MKKQLLCTSAIALGVMAAPALAQEWDLDVHGYFNQHVGYADNDVDSGNSWGTEFDGDYDEAVVHTNAEIHFTPSITLDNGLTFGVNVQLEANNNTGDDIDESYMYISGERFGKLVIGSENSAGYTMMIGAPGVTSMYINSPSVSAYVPFSLNSTPGLDNMGMRTVDADGVPVTNGIFKFRDSALSSYTEVAGNNDVQRITYYTPSFNGFMVGVSYAPSGNAQTGGADNNYVFNRDKNKALNDVFDIGASYNQTFGLTEVSIAARYGTGSAKNGSDPETWGVGAQFGYNGFTIGGSYAENDNGVYGPDSNGWSLGVTYAAPNAWSFEALTYQGEVENGGRYSSGDADYSAYRIGASREIGPGVDWDIYGVYVDSDNGMGSGLDGAGNAVDYSQDIDGWGIGTAINLSF